MADETRHRDPPQQPLPPTPGKPTSPPPTVVDVPKSRGLALTFLASVAVVFLLQWSQSVFIPVVIGILLAYALEPFVSILARARVPRSIGAGDRPARCSSASSDSASTACRGRRCRSSGRCPEAAQRIRERVRRMPGQPAARSEKSRRRRPSCSGRRKWRRSSPSPGRRDKATDGRGPVQKVEIVEPAFDAKSYLYWGGMNLLGAAGQFAVILFLVYFFLVTGDLYKRKFVKIAGPGAVAEEADRSDPRRNQLADLELHPRPDLHQRGRRRRDDGRRCGGWACSSTSSGGCSPASSTRFPYLGPVVGHRRPRRRRLRPVQRHSEDADRVRAWRSRSPASKGSC